MKNAIIILLIASLNAYAGGKKEYKLGASVSLLQTALIKKDTAKLSKLLSDALSYELYNGIRQSKVGLVSDLLNGNVTYNSITSETRNTRHHIKGNKAKVEMPADVSMVIKGQTVQLRLTIAQEWVWENEHWLLVSETMKQQA